MASKIAAKRRAKRKRLKLAGKDRPSIAPTVREANPRARVVDRKAQRSLEDRDAKRLTVETRAGKHGLTMAQAGNPDAGSVIGRAYIAEIINAEQYEIGLSLAITLAMERQAQGMPPATAQAQDLNAVRGIEADADENVADTIAIVRRVATLRDAVILAAGHAAWREARRVCERDEQPVSWANVRAALDALVRA